MEQKRIENSGGYVMSIKGISRVNGQLCVSRAIGDNGMKDVVIAVPDIQTITITDDDDFLIMACDGVWDYVNEEEIACLVYTMLQNNEGKYFSLYFFPIRIIILQ